MNPKVDPIDIPLSLSDEIHRSVRETPWAEQEPAAVPYLMSVNCKVQPVSP